MDGGQGATLLGAIDRTVTTSLNQAVVFQRGYKDDILVAPFVISRANAMGLNSPIRYADCSVRVELWDARPGPADADWEDFDDVPLQLDGTDSPVLIGEEPWGEDGPSLDVTGLGRMRAEVLARGRHQTLDPEEMGLRVWWLVRLWPDEHHLDALAGRPRRIAGGGPWFDPLQQARGAWTWTWARAGWSRLLQTNPAYGVLTRSLRHPSGRARTHVELAEAWARTEEQLVPSVRRSWHSDPALALIAHASGRPRAGTFDELLEAFIAIGLLLPVGGPDGPLEPNPNPPGVADFEPSWKPTLTELYPAGAAIEGELEHLVRWAPDQVLTTRPVDISTRLSVSPWLVVQALHRLPWAEWYTVEYDDEELTIRTPVTVQAAGARAIWAAQNAEERRRRTEQDL